MESPPDAAPGHGPTQQEAKEQVSALPSGQDRDNASAQHEQHIPEPLQAQGSAQQKHSSTAVSVCSEDLGKEAEQEGATQEAAETEQAQQAEQAQQDGSAEAGQPVIPDLSSTDLLGSRALGPLGLALKDSGKPAARPTAGPEPAMTPSAAQHSAPESMQRADSDAVHRKKKRSGFGSLFKRKGSPIK